MPLALYRDARGDWHFRPRIEESSPSALIAIPDHASFNGRSLFVAERRLLRLSPAEAYYAAFLGIFGFRMWLAAEPIELPCRRRRRRMRKGEESC